VILSLAFSLGFASQPNALGQGYATVSVKQYSSSLNGTVSAGDGETLEKVSVAVCDKGFHECSETTLTDKAGSFSVARQKNQRVYYLRFSLAGMDPMEAVVTLKRGSGPLNIKMIVAT